jgi:hypothetical protein
MKTILLFAAIAATAGCANLHQTQQVDIVEARVVKIDTIFRYAQNVKQLTWKDSDDIEYVSYAFMQDKIFEVGTSVFVMRKR